MSEVPDNNFLQTTGGNEKQPAETEDGGCFEPFILPVAAPPAPEAAPKPEPRSFMPLIDEILCENGCPLTPTDMTPGTGLAAPAAEADTDDAETAQPIEIPSASVDEPLPHRVATVAELFTWMKQSLLAQTHLPDDAAELVAFWLISTWFQDALTVLPCLVITGSAHCARGVLHFLAKFCRKPALLAGFRRSHLGVLRWGCQTNLVSEPNLDKRTADLLSNLTDRRFSVVEGLSLVCYSKSTAIYAGENPETHTIQNSIHIHIAPTSAEPFASPQWLQKMIERVPVHFDQYRNRYVRHIQHWTWAPSGLSSETATIATALGRCIVDAPELREKLVALLKTHDMQRHSEMSNTTEAIVLEATRALSRDGREHAYAREIADEANHLLEARGEAARLSPEKVGHRLKKLGLRTHPLSQSGHGLTFDKATVARVQQLATIYLMEDALADAENLHSSQVTETKNVEEVMEVMKDF